MNEGCLSCIDRSHVIQKHEIQVHPVPESIVFGLFRLFTLLYIFSLCLEFAEISEIKKGAQRSAMMTMIDFAVSPFMVVLLFEILLLHSISCETVKIQMISYNN